tara:strand:+ start:1581 stop:1853 length:273 start_codon:yes stop_codon:yes gene_type:complete
LLKLKTEPNSPEEYIQVCKELAFDKSYKEAISSEIKNKKKYLFNDQMIYKEYIQFFKYSLKAAKKDTLLPLDWKANISKKELISNHKINE